MKTKTLRFPLRSPYLETNRGIIICVSLEAVARSIFCVMWMAQDMWTGNLIEHARDALNNPEFISKDAPRIYLYLKTDKMVRWREIEGHIKEAKGHGWKAETVKFEESGHVEHVREDKDKYWGSTLNVWTKL
jgi:hypothetical protein